MVVQAGGGTDRGTDLDHGLVAQLLLISLLEVEAAVVQGLVVVLLEDLGEEGLHVLLHPAPLPVLLLQPAQHHRDGHAWVLLDQLYNLVSLLACSKRKKRHESELSHVLLRQVFHTLSCVSEPCGAPCVARTAPSWWPPLDSSSAILQHPQCPSSPAQVARHA